MIFMQQSENVFFFRIPLFLMMSQCSEKVDKLNLLENTELGDAETILVGDCNRRTSTTRSWCYGMFISIAIPQGAVDQVDQRVDI
ncbi:hypothetical protein TNCT_145371 [Trichonephila clavata]|uniref:Uncharacterized protein n=1 Tax=Trichonephila clavata TaxID=2740835 RepID=A0A8X6IYR4_TRICU|nr:hypothetical protein TNCT_145371 [Trichonephila clavata]